MRAQHKTGHHLYNSVPHSTLGSVLLLALLCPFARHAEASPQKTDSKPFTAADIFSLKTVDDVQISPDGRQIAFVQGANDIQTDRRPRYAVDHERRGR